MELLQGKLDEILAAVGINLQQRSGGAVVVLDVVHHRRVVRCRHRRRILDIRLTRDRRGGPRSRVRRTPTARHLLMSEVLVRELILLLLISCCTRTGAGARFRDAARTRRCTGRGRGRELALTQRLGKSWCHLHNCIRTFNHVRGRAPSQSHSQRNARAQPAYVFFFLSSFCRN
uniref:(northern house mosquito) hypothetical protein n=1 Tax=Culex pipiens TaxID=7175 RepID=A0A8D8N452_CULPI